MKKTKFVSSLAMFAIGISCFLPAAANAETVTQKEKAQIASENVNSSTEKTDAKNVNKESKVAEESKAPEKTDVKKTDVKKEVTRVETGKTTVSNAQLIITTSEKTTTIDLNGTNDLSKISEEYGLTLNEYRNSNGETLDPEYKVSDKEKVLLFKSEVSAKSEVVELQIPTIEKKSDKVYIGEKEVESEGKEGKALKTFVETTDLSADKKVNADATADTVPTAQVDSLTVLVKPEPKIVLIGTKEKPEPVVIEEPVVEESAVEENVEEAVTEESETTVDTDSNVSQESSITETIDRDPISGEPLNTNVTSSSSNRSSTSSSRNLGSSSTPNGAKVTASSTKPSSIVSSKKERGQKAVDLAYTRLGSDYNWASSGENAFDCSGLIYWVYQKNLGVDIPRTAKQQGSSAQQISINELQPGDLLWTNSHIGLYIGNGEMIHASRSNDEVVVSGIGWFVSDGAKAARIK